MENLKEQSRIHLELDENIPETYFVDFLRDMPEPSGDEPDDYVFEIPKIYEEIPEFHEVANRLMFFMNQYNETIRGSKMDLVFFNDAIIHMIIISRILRTAGGNALLIGVGGSGKQSLTKLASFIAGYKTFQISMTRNYNLNNLIEDLKFLYKSTGLHGNGTTFIFTENEIKDESFLEYLNNILSSGEVASLFTRDEINEMLMDLVPVMKKLHPRRQPTLENLYDFFISRTKANLHVALCFSPVSYFFKNRMTHFCAGKFER